LHSSLKTVIVICRTFEEECEIRSSVLVVMTWLSSNLSCRLAAQTPLHITAVWPSSRSLIKFEPFLIHSLQTEALQTSRRRPVQFLSPPPRHTHAHRALRRGCMIKFA